MPDLTNMQKYANYKEQMERLNRAMKEHFFLEAMFIEYAVMEDRCESTLTHAGVFRPDRHFTIVRKLRRIEALTQSNATAKRYFSQDLIDRLLAWKDKRNAFIHALMKQTFTGEELEGIVHEGLTLTKTLCSRAQATKERWNVKPPKKQKKTRYPVRTAGFMHVMVSGHTIILMYL